MLPSEKTALIILDRGWGAALPSLVSDLAERTALIAVGLFLAGQRTRVIRLALAGALVVEIGVLHYVARGRRNGAQ